MLWRSLLAAVLMAGAAAAGEGGAKTADAALRHVNGGIITLTDLERRRVELGAYLRPPPSSSAALAAELTEVVEQLTDDLLLLQEADRLGVQVDRRRIGRMIYEDARRAGRGMTLAEQSYRQRQLERQQRIDAVIGFYGERMLPPLSEEIAALYAADPAAFLRPARAWVTVIALLPTPEAERQRVATETAQFLVREAQAIADPPLHAAAVAARAAYLNEDATLETQAVAVRGLLDAFAAAATAALPAADARLVERAVALRTAAAAMRTRAQIDAAAAEIAAGLAALPASARAEAGSLQARGRSQGPNAASGGGLDAVEPGRFGEAFDAAVFAGSATSGSVVGPFASGAAVWTVLIRRLEPAHQRTLDEVRGELEARLRRERPGLIRTQLAAMLRRRAAIQDVISLADLLR